MVATGYGQIKQRNSLSGVDINRLTLRWAENYRGRASFPYNYKCVLMSWCFDYPLETLVVTAEQVKIVSALCESPLTLSFLLGIAIVIQQGIV